MEEDGGVRAPVTRLRRRLSVELSDDTKSPSASAPSTPTKKRGGRLAAKPQLELIDEDVPQNSPKRIARKSLSRDIVDPAEEKPVTPSRRSTRIRSTTSLVEPPLAGFDSPRAKRAAVRRKSQVGSDSEAPVTPARTRLTRKDSTSSIDKQEVAASETPVTPAVRQTRKNSTSSVDKQENDPANIHFEVTIIEEPEPSPATKIDNGLEAPKTSPPRKSPRLQIKRGRKSASGTSDNDNDNMTQEHEANKVAGSVTSKSNDALIAESNNTSKHEADSIIHLPELENDPASIHFEVTIIEEPEPSPATKIDNGLEAPKTSPPRKSPRLHIKRGRKSASGTSDNENDNMTQENEANKVAGSVISESNDVLIAESNNTSKHEDDSIIYLPKSSTTMIKYPITKINKKYVGLNKSTSALDDNSKSKRHRTKSWTTLTVPQTNEGQFYSDNESTKKKLRKFNKLFSLTGSGDSALSSNEQGDSSKTERTEIVINASVKKKRHSENSGYNLNKSTLESKSADISNESNKENLIDVDSEAVPIPADLFFQHSPSNIQSMISIEDSTTYSIGKKVSDKPLLLEDQCVPVINHQIQNQTDNKANTSVSEVDVQNLDFVMLNKVTNNDSCEPMDIDESISNVEVLNDSSEQNKFHEEIQGQDNPKLTTCTPGVVTENNKSNRKSSISQNLNKSDNENKSTLVLSQIKDLSSTEHNMTKSPKPSNNKLSNSTNTPNFPKGLGVTHSLSPNCLTSTPVQQKDTQKLSKQVTTTINLPQNHDQNGIIETRNDSKKDISKVSRNSDSSEEDDDEIDVESVEEGTDDESSKDKNNFMADEAEDAGDDYESGDSQDEDEGEYERQNEILEKGETLTSEEDMSDDSDYEKDSFVVSADEEDNELLSGSGDDLNMSDNELSMSGKSKKKFNERSIKQQKKASREMFESRHKLDESGKSAKTTKSKKNTRLDSTQESEIEILAPPKKNKRMRLDSNWDSSVPDEADFIEKVVDEIGFVKKKKSKRLSESMTENPEEEKETTASENKDSTMTSEIGNKKKKKSKRLSESMSEDVLHDETVYENNKDSTITSEVGNKKKKKSKRLSESMSEDVRDDETVYEKKNTTNNANVEEEIGYKKKKSKRLSESICNDSVINEKEITVCNNSTLKEDPLFIQVKLEPKTPQKGLDISTVHFTDREEMEEVHIDENTSIMKPNDSLDPLQATMAQEEDEDHDDSSISENEEAIKNYESVLNDLYEQSTRKQIKSHDISLNLHNKTKKVHEPILDQLNITDTKKPKTNKKSKNVDSETDNSKTKVNSFVKQVVIPDDETTTDSIDLKLLFSDDSNDSVKANKGEPTVENVIPLKRTEGKTNIRESIGGNETFGNGSVLNTSSNKKKKSKALQNEDIPNEAGMFFIDTAGTLNTSENNSLNTSTKKDKKSNISYGYHIEPEAEPDIPSYEHTGDGPLEISYKSDKKKSKKASKKEAQENPEIPADSSMQKTPGSEKKKKKKLAELQSIEKSGDKSDEHEGNNVFYTDTAGTTLNTSVNSLNTSTKKNKKVNVSFTKNVEPEEFDSISDVKSDVPVEVLYKCENKKNKKAKNILPEDDNEKSTETLLKTPSSDKKKKKKSKSLNVEQSELVPTNHAHNMSLDTKHLEQRVSEAPVIIQEQILEPSKEVKSAKKRKRKHLADNIEDEVATVDVIPDEDASIQLQTKRQKKKLKISQDNEDQHVQKEVLAIPDEEASTELQTKRQKKKLKISQDNVVQKEAIDANKDNTPVTHKIQEADNSNKNIKKKKDNEQAKKQSGKPDHVKDAVSKKRKERDDDSAPKKSKILKENSFDKIHIPRLPAAILNQIEDKPRKEVLEAKKSSVISTTQFSVEENKQWKNKPSNFLEESVYLNDDDAETPAAKKKRNVKRPKVLPFIPTASTSGTGFTSNFQIKVLPKTMEFVAQSDDVNNFKNDYLLNKKKKFNRYDLYKRGRNINLSKF